MPNQLDHIVIAHPDLDLAMEEFADLTGCSPKYGGPHLGGGTHNALVSLGRSVYIELISPDPTQVNKDESSTQSNLGHRLTRVAGNTLLAWAIGSNSLDQMAGKYCGITTAKPFDMARQQPNGETLHWRLMNLLHHGLKGFAPFYIDWLDCVHPAATNPVAGEFVSLEITHTDQNLGALAADTIGVEFNTGSPNFVLNFNSERGPISLGNTNLEGFWS